MPPFLLALLACADTKIDLGALQTPEDIADACAEYEPEEITLEVAFPAQTASCPWSEDDNLDPADGLLTARVEQTESLSLPSDAVICDMALDFSGLVPGEVQVMVYDDHFFFTFNDTILASSSAYIVDEMDDADGLRTWDWADAAGFDYHAVGSDHPSYCLGEDEGLSECDIPSTETPGEISMGFDDALVAQLSLAAIAESRFEFAFVTTGDDDIGRDCNHESFGFTVTVPYLTP
jgi:hypothetical protein